MIRGKQRSREKSSDWFAPAEKRTYFIFIKSTFIDEEFLMQVMTAFFPWLRAETGETLCTTKLRGDAKRAKSLLISLVSDERK